MNKFITVVLGLMFAIGLGGMAVAGSIDTASAPSAGSGMYSLSQIYDYLNSGTVAPTPSLFQEASAAPGSTMQTTKQIYDDIKTKFDLCDSSVVDVASGKKFFSTISGSWGVRTGTSALTGDAVAADVINGKHFYSNSWTQQTGTLTEYPPPPDGWTGNCIRKTGDVQCPSGYDKITAGSCSACTTPSGCCNGCYGCSNCRGNCQATGGGLQHIDYVLL